MSELNNVPNAACYPTKVGGVEVPVSNLERSINWYERVLGMKNTWQGEVNGSLCATMIFEEPMSIFLFLVETEQFQPLAFKHSVIDFYTPDLVGFHRYAKELGVEVTRDNVEARGGFGFKDPDGNFLGAYNVG
jgi:glyoxylase I family protein